MGHAMLNNDSKRFTEVLQSKCHQTHWNVFLHKPNKTSHCFGSTVFNMVCSEH